MAGLMSLSDSDELRVRRALRPRPMMNLRFKLNEGDTSHPQTLLHEAHTPVLVLNPASDVGVGPLRSFIAEAQSEWPGRADSLRYEPVSQCAPIYRIVR